MGPPGKTAAKAAKEKIVKKKKKKVVLDLMGGICSATLHQNKIDKLLKMINSEEFYDWDDKDIDRLTKIIKHAMCQPSSVREDYLEICL